MKKTRIVLILIMLFISTTVIFSSVGVFKDNPRPDVAKAKQNDFYSYEETILI